MAFERITRSLLAFVFGTLNIPEDKIGWVRAQQIGSFKRLAIGVILANILNCAALTAVFWDSPRLTWFLVWSGAIGICMLALLRVWYRDYKREYRPQTASTRAIFICTRDSAILGTIWGIMPVFAFYGSAQSAQMVVAVVCAGMMCGGAFMLSTVPSAALAFIAPIFIGCLTALIGEGSTTLLFLSALLLSYVGVLCAAIHWNHRTFVRQLLDQVDIEEKSQLISLLLRDFEENASDWLWQTDADGKIRVPSERFSTVMGSAPNALEGQDFQTLLGRNQRADQINDYIESRETFRDQIIQVATQKGHRWWSLTGKPTYEAGTFVGYRGVASDVTEAKRAEAKISYLALYDGLTGLPNRTLLRRTLDKRLEASKIRERDPWALLFLDLDNFKWVNDTSGHLVGDELLKQVATRLRGFTQDGTIVARLGGDEFAMVVQRWEQAEDVEKLADKVLETLKATYVIDSRKIQCGASIGIRLVESGDWSAEQLLKHADIALYGAKSMGRGKTCVFNSKMDVDTRERRQTEGDLQSAVRLDELRAYYQPIIDTHTGDVTSCEALMRWQHAGRGLLEPAEFISLAEESNLIIDLGDWILRQALNDVRQLPPHIGISVNLSPIQFGSDDLVISIREALEEMDVVPSRLELEITESVLMDDTESTLRVLHQLREMGIGISLDDFGTGFSALSYLRSFPFNKIKIDRAFVKDLQERDDSRAIVRAVTSLAHDLGMRVTAEGVENIAQLDFLKKEGCAEVQGFLFGKPQPIDDLLKMLGEPPASVKASLGQQSA